MKSTMPTTNYQTLNYNDITLSLFFCLPAIYIAPPVWLVRPLFLFHFYLHPPSSSYFSLLVLNFSAFPLKPTSTLPKWLLLISSLLCLKYPNTTPPRIVGLSSMARSSFFSFFLFLFSVFDVRIKVFGCDCNSWWFLIRFAGWEWSWLISKDWTSEVLSNWHFVFSLILLNMEILTVFLCD